MMRPEASPAPAEKVMQSFYESTLWRTRYQRHIGNGLPPECRLSKVLSSIPS